MSYKAALAGVPQGGGKAVILEPARPYDRTLLFQSFGRFVNDLGGRYITAADSGTSLDDLNQTARFTRWISGTGVDGHDPSPLTALGVFCGIEAAVTHVLKRDSLQGVRVAVQGLGQVGSALAQRLHEAGAILLVSEKNTGRLDAALAAFGAEPFCTEDLPQLECDVLAPCALGHLIDHTLANQLRCAIIAGAANNQLTTPEVADRLHERGIFYAPDYVINAGGLIRVSLAYLKYPFLDIEQRTRQIASTLITLIERSQSENRSPARLADQMAEAILYGSSQER
jgi:leucine dehydrogenase